MLMHLNADRCRSSLANALTLQQCYSVQRGFAAASGTVFVQTMTVEEAMERCAAHAPECQGFTCQENSSEEPVEVHFLSKHDFSCYPRAGWVVYYREGSVRELCDERRALERSLASRDSERTALLQFRGD